MSNIALFFFAGFMMGFALGVICLSGAIVVAKKRAFNKLMDDMAADYEKTTRNK